MNPERRNPASEPVATEVERDQDDHALQAFHREPGSLAQAPPTSVVPSPPAKSRGNPRALWNQPVQTQLLALPLIVAFIWWRWLGFSGWSWLVVLAAIPPSVLYFRTVRRVGHEDESHELPPLPPKHHGD